MNTATTGLNLTKLNEQKAVVLNLKKQIGLEGQTADVVLALDYSGSMSRLYNSGEVQRVVERLMPIAMGFDDNSQIDCYLYSNRYQKLENITMDNLSGYVYSKVQRSGLQMSGTSYAPVLRAIFDDFTKTGGFMGLGAKRKKQLDRPVYVIMISDGNCDDRADTEAVIREASSYGLFFSFVGIGREQFQFLDKLDSLSGREIDNASFFKVENLASLSDEQLYQLLLKEFPAWIPQVRQKGYIK